MQGRTLNIFLSTALFSLTAVITFTLQNSCCQAEQQQHFGKVYSSYPYHNDFPIHCPHSSVSRKGNSRNSLGSRHFTRHSSHLHLPDQIKALPHLKKHCRRSPPSWQAFSLSFPNIVADCQTWSVVCQRAVLSPQLPSSTLLKSSPKSAFLSFLGKWTFIGRRGTKQAFLHAHRHLHL